MKITMQFAGVVLAATVLALPATAALAARSAADQALYEKARKACSGPQFPNGANIRINYAKGWFRCDPPRERGRR